MRADDDLRPPVLEHLDARRSALRPREPRHDHPACALPGQLPEHRRLRADDGQRHPLGEPELLEQYTFSAAEALEVSGRHVRDYHDARLDDFAVASHLARKVRARLQHQRLGVVRSFQDRHRHADQVVEVRPRRVDPVPGAERRGNHFLGGGLPVRAGHRHDRPGNGATPVPAEIAQRAQRVGDFVPDEPGERRCPRPDHRPGRARANRFRQKRMSVEPLTHERHEQGARRDCTRVGGDPRVPLLLRRTGQAERRAHGGIGPDHRPSSRSRTTARSSNGRDSVPITW